MSPPIMGAEADDLLACGVAEFCDAGPSPPVIVMITGVVTPESLALV